MARNVTNIRTYLDTRLGTEPFLVLRVWWDYNSGDIAYYTERKIAHIPVGQLLSVSGLDTIVKANFLGSSSEAITVQLADIDGSIKARLNNKDIHKVYCFLYQAYAETNSIAESAMSLLFQGQISSPISWNTLDNIITFDIVTELEVNETGFSIEQGQFANLPEESVGQTFPICFGSPIHVPAVKISSVLQGIIAVPVNKLSLSELQALYKLIQEMLPYYITYEQAKSVYESGQSPYYNIPNQEAYLEIIETLNESKIKVEQLIKMFIKRLPDSVTEIRILADDYFYYQYYMYYINIYNTTLENLRTSLAYQLQLIDTHPGETQFIAQCQKEVTRIEDEITNYTTLVSTYTGYATIYTNAAQELEKTLADLTNLTFVIAGGEKFPQNTNVVIKINNAKLQGRFNGNIFTADTTTPFLATYRNIEIGTRLNEDNPTEFWLEDENVNLKNMFCLIQTNIPHDVQLKVFRVIEQIGKLCYIKPILWSQTKPGNKYIYEPLYIKPSNVAYIKEASPILLSTWNIDRTKSSALTGLYYDYTEDKSEKPWMVEVGDIVELDAENQEVYVCNHVPSIEIHEVVAYRKINGKQVLCPIPQSYFTIHLNYRLGNMYTTLIVFKRPLYSYDENWDDQIFVTLTSVLSSNVSEIIKWLIESYTTYTVDAASFLATAIYTINYPCNFALINRHNIINLIEDIAWQARCIVYIYNNVVYLRYISRLPASYDSLITESDIDIESIIVTFTNTEDIVTKLCGNWKLSYTQEYLNKVIVRNKTSKYGIIEQEYDFFIYNDAELVRKSLAFWLIRYSNSWKIIKFKTYLRNLHLQAYDFVRLDFTNLNPLGKQTAVYGYVLSAAYNSNDGTITLEIWTAIRAGENFLYPLAWPSNAGGYAYPTVYDLYAGGASDRYADTLSNGGEILGLTYGDRVHDIGPMYLDDSYDNYPESKIDGKELVDYSIMTDYQKPQTSITQIDLHNTKIYDSVTGLKAPLTTLLSVAKGIPQVPFGSEQIGDIARVRTTICLNKDAMVLGDYYESEDVRKNIMAPLDMEYNKDYRTWMLHLEKSRPFLAKITGAIADGPNIWKYSWIEVIPQTHKAMSESGIPYQRSGNSAYNLIELVNNGHNIEGNSVNHNGASFPDGFSMVSAGAGEPIIVIMYPIFSKENVLCYYFQYENADDGVCI